MTTYIWCRGVNEGSVYASMEGLTKFLFRSASALFFIFATCAAVDTIAANQIIRDGDTLVSASEDFELGFFRPGNSSQIQYLGIWYKKISTGTVVWVANRDTPLTNTTGSLTLNHAGILLLQNATNTTIWSTNSSVNVRNPVAQLLDTGNLVIRDQSDNFIWQSFDYPTDTFLPEMKIGKDLVTGLDRYLRSSKSANDPSSGDYTISMDINGYPQIFQKVNSAIQFRLGSWNGMGFTGLPSLKPNPIYTFDFVFNQKEVYYEYKLIRTSVITRMILTPDGTFQRLQWIDRTRNWKLYLAPATDSCARYALCGPYGSCNIDNSPACGCLQGFVPTNPDEWIADWIHGCTRRTRLTYGNEDGFRKYSGMKLPDTRYSWFNQSMNHVECETACKSNGSCTAYSNMDIRGRGSGCFLWFGPLFDLREYPENGQDLYIRMAASEVENDRRSSRKKRIRSILIPVLSVLTVGLGLCLLYVYKRRKLKKQEKKEPECGHDYNIESQNYDLELPLYSLSTLSEATNNFSVNNQVGEGGFGPVYKGVLENGQEIAVKRLSKTSTQGLEQLKNEVICITKLQHRNLVKLLGCYIQGEEKMLVYEYMPNKSLDSFIFDESKRTLLDWPKRIHIIYGIARGLLYLHQDSRLRIIHRDLKAGNILLDFEMNPKISDFGLARSFQGNENKANTKRVAGTYGYMSPEYAGDGIFSVKSDVFSFGVLVLEIVSGMKNSGFFHLGHNHNLLGHAWILHNEGRSMELVDASISIDDSDSFEVLRSIIQVGLLCVQQGPGDRPTMSSVVLMLGSDGVLPQPRQPGFFNEISIPQVESSSGTGTTTSTNQVTMTLLAPR